MREEMYSKTKLEDMHECKTRRGANYRSDETVRFGNRI